MKRETYQGCELPTVAEARKWANALRSGKFKRGFGRLQSADNSYCCLGVACVLFIPEKERVFDPLSELLSGSLPDAQPCVPEWLRRVNQIVYDVAWATLDRLNDSYCYSFQEIADVIELVFIYARKDIFQ